MALLAFIRISSGLFPLINQRLDYLPLLKYVPLQSYAPFKGPKTNEIL